MDSEVDSVTALQELAKLLEAKSPDFLYEQTLGRISIEDLSFGLDPSFKDDNEPSFRAGTMGVIAQSATVWQLASEIWFMADCWGDGIGLALTSSSGLDDAIWSHLGINDP